MGLSVSAEDAVWGGGGRNNSVCKMLHLQLRLQAGRVGDYTSAWREELQHKEGK